MSYESNITINNDIKQLAQATKLYRKGIKKGCLARSKECASEHP